MLWNTDLAVLLLLVLHFFLHSFALLDQPVVVERMMKQQRNKDQFEIKLSYFMYVEFRFYNAT